MTCTCPSPPGPGGSSRAPAPLPPRSSSMSGADRFLLISASSFVAVGFCRPDIAVSGYKAACVCAPETKFGALRAYQRFNNKIIYIVGALWTLHFDVQITI